MDLDAFLKALPLIATSPYAFIAYVLLVAAWLVIGLRVRRNKNLLDALEKLPPEQRLAALQAEMGNVSPPAGLTPRQWIKSRTHAYYFFAFLALCFCLTLLVLIGYVFRDKNPSGNVSTKASLYDFGSDISKEEVNVLKYQENLGSNGVVVIEPKMPYLESIAAGKEVHGFQYWREPFEWHFPKLSIKVANNSKDTLLISSILFEVLDSAIDKRPIPLIHESFYNKGNIRFINEGWGEMIEPQLTIRGWHKPVKSSNDIIFMWRMGDSTQDGCGGGQELTGKEVSLKLGSIAERLDVPVSKHTPFFLRGEPLICAIGSISYKSEGKPARTSMNFRTLVSQFSPGPGVPAPPSAEYDLFLPAGKKGYVATVPVSQEVKPGETDNFLITISSDKSAFFALKYQAKDVANVIREEQSISLHLFLPRSGADRGELSGKYFPGIPIALWGDLPLAKSISRIAHHPDNKADIRIFLNDAMNENVSCDAYYDVLFPRLERFYIKDEIRFAITDAEGTMFCTGSRTIQRKK